MTNEPSLQNKAALTQKKRLVPTTHFEEYQCFNYQSNNLDVTKMLESNLVKNV